MLSFTTVFGAKTSRQNGQVWLTRACIAKHSGHISCLHFIITCPRSFISSIHILHSVYSWSLCCFDILYIDNPYEFKIHNIRIIPFIEQKDLKVPFHFSLSGKGRRHDNLQRTLYYIVVRITTLNRWPCPSIYDCAHNCRREDAACSEIAIHLISFILISFIG